MGYKCEGSILMNKSSRKIDWEKRPNKWINIHLNERIR